ncbi:MAG: hypothetical protein FJZ62_01095 [Chlamydiae bacterium]|nr:hypothetical protein [Chlamydiota bacterium]
MNTLSSVIPHVEDYRANIFELYTPQERIQFNSVQLLSQNFLLRKPYPLFFRELEDFSLSLKKISKEPSLNEEDKKLFRFAANFFQFFSSDYNPSLPSPLESSHSEKFVELVNHMVLFDEEKGLFIPLDLARYIALGRLDFTELKVTDCIQNILYADDRNLVPYILEKKEEFFTNNLGIDTTFIKEYLAFSNRLDDSLALREFILGSSYNDESALGKILVYSPLLGPTFFTSFFDAFYPEIRGILESLEEEERQKLYDNMSILEEIDPLQKSAPYQRLRVMLE